MIEHADAALEAWLSTLDPPIDITFERAGDEASSSSRATRRPVLSLVLTSVREQLNKRDTEIADLRSDDGRVIGRQASTRFFELDYLCTVGGPARDSHRALGDLLQLLVDHDIIPVEHVPQELAALGYPIDAMVVSPPTSIAALTLRVVLPVQPTPSRDIGPPATSLHLDMSPPPVPKQWGTQKALTTGETPVGPVPEKKWTTVRRRELINRQQHAAVVAEEAAAKPKQPRKGG
jgi:hypothetical protein